MAKRKRLLVMKRPEAKLPDRHELSEQYHRVCNRAGAYMDMYHGFYPYRLELNMGFDMPEGQARELVRRVPELMILENTPHDVWDK